MKKNLKPYAYKQSEHYSEVRGQRSEVRRSQKLEVGSRKIKKEMAEPNPTKNSTSDIRHLTSEIRHPISDLGLPKCDGVPFVEWASELW